MIGLGYLVDISVFDQAIGMPNAYQSSVDVFTDFGSPRYRRRSDHGRRLIPGDWLAQTETEEARMKSGDLMMLLLMGGAAYLLYSYMQGQGGAGTSGSAASQLLAAVTQSSDPTTGLPLVTTPYAPIAVVTLT